MCVQNAVTHSNWRLRDEDHCFECVCVFFLKRRLERIPLLPLRRSLHRCCYAPRRVGFHQPRQLQILSYCRVSQGRNDYSLWFDMSDKSFRQERRRRPRSQLLVRVFYCECYHSFLRTKRWKKNPYRSFSAVNTRTAMVKPIRNAMSSAKWWSIRDRAVSFVSKWLYSIHSRSTMSMHALGG